jgi:hypothetical protein
MDGNVRWSLHRPSRVWGEVLLQRHPEHSPSTSASCVIFSMLLAWPRRARRSNPKWVEWVGTAIQLPRRQHCGRSHAEVQSQPEHTWGRLLSLEPSLYSASPALKLASWRPVDDDR